jgi:hypothetical protein
VAAADTFHRFTANGRNTLDWGLDLSEHRSVANQDHALAHDLIVAFGTASFLESSIY